MIKNLFELRSVLPSSPQLGQDKFSSPPASPERKRVRWWRRIYVVNREFQGKFALSAVVVGVFSSFVSAGLLLWTFWTFNIWQGQRFPMPVNLAIIFVLLMNTAGIYIAGVLATQKIAGPMFNLLKQFERLGQGDFTALAKFREHDEMHYVARSFNEMSTKLAARNEVFMKNVQDASAALAEGKYSLVEQKLEALLKMHQTEPKLGEQK